MSRVSPFIFAFLGAAFAIETSAATLAQIKARGFMVVAVPALSSPFGSIENGKASGFDTALIDDLARSVPFPIRRQLVSSDNLEAALLNGDVDAVTGSIEITASRQRSIVFSSPVAEMTRYFMRRKGDRLTARLEDLGGRRLGTVLSSGRLTDIAEFENRLAKAGGRLGEVTGFQTIKEACDALIAGKVDFVVSDVVSLEAIANEHPNDLEIGEPVSRKIYAAWSTAKDNVDVGALISDFLIRERSSGALAILQRKFLGRVFSDMPVTVTASDWWTARTRPAVMPIPQTVNPD